MRLIFALFMLLSSLLADDFITRMEYAKLLYLNPRGIGCNKCHGEDGKGSVIASYVQKGKQKVLSAPAVNNVSKDKFFAALNNPKSVMPKYSLTAEEFESLYEYVSSKR
ncbi:MAG: c-type cytochrome [Campylobacteraceae bacterium]|jgi:mono/diheme cytochrome c family protein|nr:c-type cytochrome [Campylobacteraceae bacterium]